MVVERKGSHGLQTIVNIFSEWGADPQLIPEEFDVCNARVSEIDFWSAFSLKWCTYWEPDCVVISSGQK